jgi:hypothetical protein
MAEGPMDPDDRPEDGPVLAPEELDIADDEHVEQLEEGRFVVSSEARTGSTAGHEQGASTGREPEPEPEPDRAERGGDLDSEAVHEWLRGSFEDSSAKYGFDVTAAFEGSVGQRRMASNDVVTIFESLMLWYAQGVDSDTPVEEVLGILLMESNVPVRYPPESLRELVESTDLDPEDTVADLLAAVEDDDGVTL